MKKSINYYFTFLSLLFFIGCTTVKDNKNIYDGYVIMVYYIYSHPNQSDMHGELIFLPKNNLDDFEYYYYSDKSVKINYNLWKNGSLSIHYSSLDALACCEYKSISQGIHRIMKSKSKDSILKYLNEKEISMDAKIHRTQETLFKYDIGDYLFYEIEIYKGEFIFCDCKKNHSSFLAHFVDNFYFIQDILNISSITEDEKNKFDEIFKNIINYK